MNLIEKLQQATEGSRELDVLIHNAVYGTKLRLLSGSEAVALK